MRSNCWLKWFWSKVRFSWGSGVWCFIRAQSPFFPKGPVFPYGLVRVLGPFFRVCHFGLWRKNFKQFEKQNGGKQQPCGWEKITSSLWFVFYFSTFVRLSDKYSNPQLQTSFKDFLKKSKQFAKQVYIYSKFIPFVLSPRQAHKLLANLRPV